MNGWSVAVFALGGCATAGTFQSAETLGPGGWEVGGDVSVLRILDPSADDPWLPSPRGVLRVGVSERVDVGGSVGVEGLRLQTKVQATPTDDTGVMVSLMPGVRLLPLPRAAGDGAALIGVDQTGLVGFPTSATTQLVASVRSAQDVALVDDPGVLVWVGGALGWTYRPADAPARVMPEVGAMAIVAGPGDGQVGVIAQAGVGVVLGRKK